MQETRLYQIGTFAAGNRLLDPEDNSVQSDADRPVSSTLIRRAPKLSIPL